MGAAAGGGRGEGVVEVEVAHATFRLVLAAVPTSWEVAALLAVTVTMKSRVAVRNGARSKSERTGQWNGWVGAWAVIAAVTAATRNHPERSEADAAAR